ncbi:MAG: crosslink repair DNA glycosylase YcaQ family protein [Pseudomonadota bacterium]
MAESTITLTRQADLARLRKIALGAQGLLLTSPFGRGLGGARRAIRHTGYVQIDTISVVQRAHHHVFRSRVPNYHPDMLHRLLKQRSIFEYWAHAAAFLPMEDFRFSLPYKEAIKSGKRHWFRSHDRKLMSDLLQRITAEGPLRSRDVEQGKRGGAGWWDWKPAKRALEQLYMQGDLMVAERAGFQKTYDLPERILPADIDLSAPSIDEYASHLIEQQLRCHQFVSLKGVTYLRRDSDLRQAVNRQINTMLAEQQLQTIKLASGEKFVCQAGLLDQPAPRTTNRLLILSPFDNAVIQRARLQSIFNFDYQIECYVPEAKRQYGYFCLPLLFRDQFVGRLDGKAHRKNAVFEIKALHLHPETLAPGQSGQLLEAFAAALPEFLDFQDCQTLQLGSVTPSALHKPLRQVLSATVPLS